MQSWRLLAQDTAVSAARGLAFDEALLGAYHRDAPPAPPTLRLYTYRSHCALVGRYQDLNAEVDLAACREIGAEVGRRPTGGGAIVMGAGQLGIALATRAPAGERPREMLTRFAQGVSAGLAELGVSASLRGKNDLEVDGRKIAGLGVYVDDDGGLLFHASVLADLDVELMLTLLRVPAVKLADKAAASVHERVTTLTQQTGRPMDGAGLREVLALGFAKAFTVELEPGAPTSAELAATEDLAQRRYLDEAWLGLHGPSTDATGTAAVKTPSGLLRAYVAARGQIATSVLFSGDLMDLPASVRELESLLRWGRLQADAVDRAVRASGAAGDLGCAPEVLTQAVLSAAAGAAQPAAFPARAQGSCYYPEQVREGDH